jgi:hypothetical protein
MARPPKGYRGPITAEPCDGEWPSDAEMEAAERADERQRQRRAYLIKALVEEVQTGGSVVMLYAGLLARQLVREDPKAAKLIADIANTGKPCDRTRAKPKPKPNERKPDMGRDSPYSWDVPCSDGDVMAPPKPQPRPRPRVEKRPSVTPRTEAWYEAMEDIASARRNTANAAARAEARKATR